MQNKTISFLQWGWSEKCFQVSIWGARLLNFAWNLSWAPQTLLITDILNAWRNAEKLTENGYVISLFVFMLVQIKSYQVFYVYFALKICLTHEQAFLHCITQLYCEFRGKTFFQVMKLNTVYGKAKQKPQNSKVLAASSTTSNGHSLCIKLLLWVLAVTVRLFLWNRTEVILDSLRYRLLRQWEKII